MAYSIKFKKVLSVSGSYKPDPREVHIKEAARSEGYTLTAGMQEFARKRYGAKLSAGKYGYFTSISFKTEDAMTTFLKEVGETQ